MKYYTPLWFSDYEEKYGHILTIKKYEDGSIQSIHFMSYEVWIDSCNQEIMVLKSVQKTLNSSTGDFLCLFVMCLILDIDNQPGDFCMNLDMNLSDDVCVMLYDNDINIRWMNHGKSCYYDRVLIRRRHTLENIINN